MILVGIGTSVLRPPALEPNAAIVWQIALPLAALLAVAIMMQQGHNHEHLWLFCVVASIAYASIATFAIALIIA